MTNTSRDALIKSLRIKAGMMSMGEPIAWGSDTALMVQAAEMLEADALELEATERQVEILSDELSKCSKQGQAVKPVAWLVLDEDGVSIMCAPAKQMCNDYINDAINDFESAKAEKWVVREVFTQPAQQVAVPMTEAQIFACDPVPHVMFDQQRIDFARAIEAFHGITGAKP